jgi:hypothetical protein
MVALDWHWQRDGPLPWEKSTMTVCIAAAAADGKRNAIVSCNDWKVSGPLGSSETADKLWRLNRGWFALGAGVPSEIMEMARVYRTCLRAEDAEEITDANVNRVLKRPLQILKGQMADSHVQAKYAMSYSEFLKIGKERLPELNFRVTTEEIANIKLRSRFIILGFIDRVPQICKTTFDFDLEFSEDFYAIGEGSYLAEAALFQRSQHANVPLMRAAYSVYEAKRIAETVPSVGKDTSIDVFYEDFEHTIFTDKAFSYFSKKFDEIGPKKNMGKFEFEEDFLSGGSARSR